MATKLVSTGIEFPDSTTQTTEGVTSVTAGSALTGGGSGGSVTINHGDTSSQVSVNNSGNTVIQDVTVDGFGHVTNLNSTTISAIGESDVLDLFNVTGSAEVYACRAWVNFDGANAGIRGSGNVSSVSRFGTGNYGVNFSTSMVDDDYSSVVQGMDGTSNNAIMAKGGLGSSSSQARVFSGFSDSQTFVDFDANFIDVAVFR